MTPSCAAPSCARRRNSCIRAVQRPCTFARPARRVLYGCKYLNFSRSNSDMELFGRRVINELEGRPTAGKDIARYTDPDSPLLPEDGGENPRASEFHYACSSSASTISSLPWALRPVQALHLLLERKRKRGRLIVRVPLFQVKGRGFLFSLFLIFCNCHTFLVMV